MKKPKLIPGWKGSLKWYSQRINAAVASVAPVWLLFPEEMRAAALADPRFITGLVIFVSALGLLGLVGRVVDQGDAP